MSPFNPWERIEPFIYFLKRWLQQNQRPLLFLFGIYVPLAIFTILAIQIWQLEGGLAWDIALMQAIHTTAQAKLDMIAAVLTKFGTKWGVIPVSILIGIGFLYARQWRFLTYWLITLCGSGVINQLAKLWLHRVRPNLWDYPPHPEFSFPSGHAMASMGFVVALLVLTWHQGWRVWVWLLGGIFVISIGWTRLYLGVHYPSDILAGWMLSIAWAVATSLVVKPLLLPQTSAQSAPHQVTQTPAHSSDLTEL